MEREFNRLNGLLFLGRNGRKGFIGSHLGAGFYLVGFDNEPSKGAHVVYAGEMSLWRFFETEEQRQEAIDLGA